MLIGYLSSECIYSLHHLFSIDAGRGGKTRPSHDSCLQFLHYSMVLNAVWDHDLDFVSSTVTAREAGESDRDVGLVGLQGPLRSGHQARPPGHRLKHHREGQRRRSGGRA